MKASESPLEKYTISEDRESSLFCLHTSQLLKKKILMQIRDQKTLAIDTILPIVLIIMGLWLATLALFKDGSARTMLPSYIYPPTNMMYWNSNSSSTTGTSTTSQEI